MGDRSVKSVLIVDDEEKIRDVLASYLQKEGYHARMASSGKEALEILQDSVDLVILDLMLPDISGEEVCRKIRQISSVPILMLTAKVEEEDRIKGLSIGADDYVIKPFSPREVVARIKAILRRISDHETLADRIAFGDLVIDTLKRQVYKSGECVSLTPVEYKFLSILARHPERAFSREELIQKVFGFDYKGCTRSVDQHIKNLRQKIESDPKNPSYIITVYGFGYRFGWTP